MRGRGKTKAGVSSVLWYSKRRRESRIVTGGAERGEEWRRSGGLRFPSYLSGGDRLQPLFTPAHQHAMPIAERREMGRNRQSYILPTSHQSPKHQDTKEAPRKHQASPEYAGGDT
mmetsp:Transcript_46027/g.118745  ORF Transcript_46027/g.118745 Transcript_46027/m.118745 type:complete len:115 (-) Transcript_46027:209-553(-)